MDRDEAIITARKNAAGHNTIYVIFRRDGGEWDVVAYVNYGILVRELIPFEYVRFVLPNGEVTKTS